MPALKVGKATNDGWLCPLPSMIARQNLLADDVLTLPGKRRDRTLEPSGFQFTGENGAVGRSNFESGSQLSRLHYCRLSQLTPRQEIAINSSGHSQSVGRNREGGIDRCAGWHEGGIGNK